MTFTQSLFSSKLVFFSESWSLAVEEWFYFLFPLAVLGVRRLFFSDKDRALLITAVLFIILPIALRACTVIENEPDFGGGIGKATFLRLDAIMYGVLAAWVKVRKEALWEGLKKWGAPAGMAGILGVAWIMASFTRVSTDSVQVFILPLCSLSCALLLPWCDKKEWVSSARLALVLKKGAEWSYSIYLSNMLVLCVFKELAVKFQLGSEGLAGTLALEAGCIFSTILLSACVFEFFERPMTALREKLQSAPKKDECLAVREPV